MVVWIFKIFSSSVVEIFLGGRKGWIEASAIPSHDFRHRYATRGICFTHKHSINPDSLVCSLKCLFWRTKRENKAIGGHASLFHIPSFNFGLSSQRAFNVLKPWVFCVRVRRFLLNNSLPFPSLFFLIYFSILPLEFLIIVGINSQAFLARVQVASFEEQLKSTSPTWESLPEVIGTSSSVIASQFVCQWRTGRFCEGRKNSFSRYRFAVDDSGN